MKTFCLLFGYFTGITILSPFSCALAQEGFLEWSADRPLEWDDFQGKPDGEVFEVSYMDYKLDVKYDASMVGDSLVFEFKVKPLFDKENSWVAEGKKSSNLLGYEQLRFDIIEMHTRKFRKELGSTTFTKENFKDQLQAMYKATMDNIRADHRELASGSVYGSKTEEIQHWRQKVSDRLADLSGFQ